MYVPFESLPGEARVWIYQSDRNFSEQEKQKVITFLEAFTHQWAAHGNPLKASFKVEYDRFVVMAVDESHADVSGCSIDSSVQAIRHLESTFMINLLDKTRVAFMSDGGEVFMVTLNELGKSLSANHWNASTTTFNNLVSNKDEFEKNWKVAASQTWLKRYLTKMAVS